MLAALEALLRLRQAACHPRSCPARRARDAPRRSSGCARASRTVRRGGAQGARVLAVDLAARSHRAAPARPPASVHARSTARPSIAPASSARSRPTTDRRSCLISLEGRRDRAEPHRRRSRVPDGSVVESRRRGSGGRPRAPHRPGPPGDGLPASSPRKPSRSASSCSSKPSAASPTPRCRMPLRASSLTARRSPLACSREWEALRSVPSLSLRSGYVSFPIKAGVREALSEKRTFPVSGYRRKGSGAKPGSAKPRERSRRAKGVVDAGRTPKPNERIVVLVTEVDRRRRGGSSSSNATSTTR